MTRLHHKLPADINGSIEPALNRMGYSPVVSDPPSLAVDSVKYSAFSSAGACRSFPGWALVQGAMKADIHAGFSQ